jgi:hypothetical protein
MTIEIEINELDDYSKCVEYINSVKTHVTFNMVRKNCNVRPKIVNKVLANHESTMLCSPSEFGSNKNTNKKLYKKINKSELIDLCTKELKNMKQNRIITEENLKSYIYSGLTDYMFNKFSIRLNYNILKELSPSIN